MAIKQFTSNIGDLVEFTQRFPGIRDPQRNTIVGYVWRSEPTQVVLSNVNVMNDNGTVRDRSFFGDRLIGEKTYYADLRLIDSYEILKPYVAPQ